MSVATILSPFFATGQSKKIPIEKLLKIHHETADDKYLPNAHNNKKTSPAYKFKSNSVLKLSSSTVFTNQVNVDGNGQNIIDDAANEPSIAVDPLNKNNIVIGWRQFDNVTSNFRQAGWSYTSDGGLNWTFPGVLEPGIFRSDPVLEYDSSGNFYYNSLTNSPDFFCKVFISTNGGAAWNNGVDAAGGDKQWMTIDRTAGVGSGNIYASWTSDFSTCIPASFTRSTNGGSSYEACTEVDGDPFWKTMAVGNNGELYIAGGSHSSDSLVVAKSINAQIPSSTISWNPPVLVFLDGFLNGASINPAGLLGQTSVDVDRSSGPGRNNVYILASVTRISNSDPGDVMFAKSVDGGITWSSPIRINDDASNTNTQWFGTMSVAPNGRIDAVWLDTRDDPSGLDLSALYYSYSTDQGITWSVNEKLSGTFDPHVGYPNQDKMGDYFDMVSFNTGAYLAWANTLNGEQDVYFSHIVPPVASAVDEFSEIAAISIFPNPTSGTFVVNSNSKIMLLELYNPLGQKLFSKISLQTKNEIDISMQPAGIYFLKIINHNGIIKTKKIVKQ